MTTPPRPAAVHVDLDGATEIFAAHGWPNPYGDDPLFETGLRNTLNFLDRNDVRATLFVVADNLDDPRKRELLEEAVSRGHEIASHTLSHPNLRTISAGQKRREICDSRRKLEDTLGVAVLGFRAPGYSIDRESMEMLAEGGYEYDSSAFPTPVFAERLGVMADRLAKPHRPLPGCPLVELPLPDYRPSPVPFSPSYSLLLGTRFFRWGLRRHRLGGAPMIVLFHLIDLADPLPRERLCGLTSRVFTLSLRGAAAKARRCQAMIDVVRENYRVTTTRQLLDEIVCDTRVAV